MKQITNYTFSDVLPPRLLSCPNDMQIYIDSTNNTAKATWLLPEAEDNSKEAPAITEIHYYTPGQRFNAGSYTMKYTIEDKEHNRGDSCVFTLQVISEYIITKRCRFLYSHHRQSIWATLSSKVLIRLRRVAVLVVTSQRGSSFV